MRVWAVRYIVTDVDRSIAFYTQHLGFTLEQRQGAAFARVSKDGFGLILSGPGSSGARALPDGRQAEPGGWNRLVLQVKDLPSVVSTMKHAGLRLRSDIVTGPGGRQVQLEDPDGNPVELFEPASA
jgi:glyoxylase I family protein